MLDLFQPAGGHLPRGWAAIQDWGGQSDDQNRARPAEGASVQGKKRAQTLGWQTTGAAHPVVNEQAALALLDDPNIDELSVRCRDYSVLHHLPPASRKCCHGREGAAPALVEIRFRNEDRNRAGVQVVFAIHDLAETRASAKRKIRRDLLGSPTIERVTHQGVERSRIWSRGLPCREPQGQRLKNHRQRARSPKTPHSRKPPRFGHHRGRLVLEDPEPLEQGVDGVHSDQPHKQNHNALEVVNCDDLGVGVQDQGDYTHPVERKSENRGNHQKKRRMSTPTLEKVDQKDGQQGEDLDRAHTAAALDHLEGLADSQNLIPRHQVGNTEYREGHPGQLSGPDLQLEDHGQHKRSGQRHREEKNEKG